MEIMWMVSQEDLEKLTRGELKVEDLTIPEKETLLFWTGKDIKNYLELKKYKTKYEKRKVQILLKNFPLLVNKIKDFIQTCNCPRCMGVAIDYIVKEEVKKIKIKQGIERRILELKCPHCGHTESIHPDLYKGDNYQYTDFKDLRSPDDETHIWLCLKCNKKFYTELEF